MTYETLILQQTAGVATLTLNRPDAANALDPTMARELLDAAIALDEDPAVRAVILTGAGDQMFCAGGDLRSFQAAGARIGALAKEMTTVLHGAVSRLARMRAPVIAAVRGTAAGAGFSLVCASDLVIAAQSTKFTLAYTRAGLSPDGSSTFFLARIVGLRRAYELALTNRVLAADEALDWGLINRVVPDDQVAAEANDLARKIAAGPTDAFGATKRLLLEATVQSLETQMEMEARTIAGALRSADGQEGVAAFLEKRAPRFGSG